MSLCHEGRAETCPKYKKRNEKNLLSQLGSEKKERESTSLRRKINSNGILFNFNC
jgi:hypothetical protein